MLKDLHLINFRNYNDFKINFSPVTIIIGPNGIGKTNLIEAIYLISTTSSHRTNHNINLIKYSQTFSKVIAQFTKHDLLTNFSHLRGVHSATSEVVRKSRKDEIEMILNNKEGKVYKEVKLNGIPKTLSEIVGLQKTVLFSPESINIIFGSPGLRRRFLNLILAQMDNLYLTNLIELKKILRQRNKLLSLIKLRKADKNQLDFWNIKLIDINAYLTEKRETLIDLLNKYTNRFYDEISGEKNKLNIYYKISLDRKRAEEKLNAGLEREIINEKTLYGPHRDEIEFFLSDHNVLDFSSRGEARTLILALKLSEIEYIKKNSGQKPIFLLDDVFSELDKDRSKHLIDMIKDQQTIITTTNLGQIDENKLRDCQVIDLEKEQTTKSVKCKTILNYQF